MKKILKLQEIIIDKELQSRSRGLDMAHVGDLTEAYQGKNAETIETPRVFIIKGREGHWMTRGFHRGEAAVRAGKKTLECEVRNGEWADAVMDSVTSNIDHGLKRTTADKRRGIVMALAVHADWSDRKIAEELSVSHATVGEIRKENNSSGQIDQTKRLTRSGGLQTPAKLTPPKDPKTPYQHKDDKLPELKGVYRPMFLLNEDKTEVALDALNNPMPNKIGDIFADTTIREILIDQNSVAEAAHAVVSSINKLKRKSTFPFLDLVKVEKLINTIRDAQVALTDHLRDATPYIVCPKCGGSQCRTCKSIGYLSRGVYNANPEFHGRKRAL
jgi:hypothetical protein